ncbi:hypothetical protein FACS1894172_18710 [Spirochaetia bacterium]|nr:hypothetical protein FACS1894172_18710 [Spirochaetia bacterium]
MKNKWIGVAVLFSILFLLVGCGVSNIRVSKENYDKLKTGMTQEQVLEVLGKADTSSESDMGELGKIELWHYQLGGKAIDVTFENGIVIDRSWIEI